MPASTALRTAPIEPSAFAGSSMIATDLVGDRGVDHVLLSVLLLCDAAAV